MVDFRKSWWIPILSYLKHHAFLCGHRSGPQTCLHGLQASSLQPLALYPPPFPLSKPRRPSCLGGLSPRLHMSFSVLHRSCCYRVHLCVHLRCIPPTRRSTRKARASAVWLAPCPPRSVHVLRLPRPLTILVSDRITGQGPCTHPLDHCLASDSNDDNNSSLK